MKRSMQEIDSNTKFWMTRNDHTRKTKCGYNYKWHHPGRIKVPWENKMTQLANFECKHSFDVSIVSFMEQRNCGSMKCNFWKPNFKNQNFFRSRYSKFGVQWMKLYSKKRKLEFLWNIVQQKMQKGTRLLVVAGQLTGKRAWVLSTLVRFPFTNYMNAGRTINIWILLSDDCRFIE